MKRVPPQADSRRLESPLGSKEPRPINATLKFNNNAKTTKTRPAQSAESRRREATVAELERLVAATISKNADVRKESNGDSAGTMLGKFIYSQLIVAFSFF